MAGKEIDTEKLAQDHGPGDEISEIPFREAKTHGVKNYPHVPRQGDAPHEPEDSQTSEAWAKVERIAKTLGPAAAIEQIANARSRSWREYIFTKCHLLSRDTALQELRKSQRAHETALTIRLEPEWIEDEETGRQRLVQRPVVLEARPRKPDPNAPYLERKTYNGGGSPMHTFRGRKDVR